MICKNCGGAMIGDGYMTVRHCENADESTYYDHEPDAPPVYCTTHLPVCAVYPQVACDTQLGINISN